MKPRLSSPEEGADWLALAQAGSGCCGLHGPTLFSSERQRFAVFAALTDGFGDIELKLVVQRLDTLEEIYHALRILRFADRLREVRFLFRVMNRSFPVAGLYDVILFADKTELARHRIEIS